MKFVKKFLSVLLVAILAFVFSSSFHTDAAKGNGNGKGNVDPFSIEIYALNGQEMTDVYVKVTQDLEGYDLPTELKKVQLKYLINGETVVHNVKGITHEGAGLYKVAQLSDLMAHEQLEAKVHIHTDQTGDEEVLKGSTTVLLRSDVVVGDIQTPETMKVWQEYDINFIVSEANGDIGGTTLVTLMNGDTILDAKVVNIAAGEQVNVTMTVMFGNSGTYDLTVSASNVTFEQFGAEITDYDETNNYKSITIDVLPNEEINYSLGYVYEGIDFLGYSITFQEYIWGEFYDDDGEINYGFPLPTITLVDLTDGTLNVKVTADDVYINEWIFNMNELADLAQETGAAYTFSFLDGESYDDNNGEYVSQNYMNFFLFSKSFVEFRFDVDGLEDAESIVIEVILTNAAGDTWKVTKDIIQEATEEYSDRISFFLKKEYTVSGITL
jgi:hypothetical protein